MVAKLAAVAVLLLLSAASAKAQECYAMETDLKVCVCGCLALDFEGCSGLFSQLWRISQNAHSLLQLLPVRFFTCCRAPTLAPETLPV